MRVRDLILLALMCTAAVSQGFAMSLFQADEDDASTHDSAIVDAKAAYAADDLRLLGITLRLVTLPGIAQEQQQAAMERCGVRLLEAGDVIRSSEDQQALDDMMEYASRYNRFILQQCFDVDS